MGLLTVAHWMTEEGANVVHRFVFASNGGNEPLPVYSCHKNFVKMK
jgi:hypothetical protein